MNRRLLLTLAAFSLVPLAPAVATACAVCLTGAGGEAAADGFNGSVLFLMAAPYLVVGAIAGWLVYAYRRAAAKRKDAARPEMHLVWNQKESGR